MHSPSYPLIHIVYISFLSRFRYQSHEISKMDGSWLFPVLAPIVLSGTGGIVASVLPPAHARLTIIVSYIIWGYGFPLAFMMLVLDFFRLVMHNLPVPGSIVSMFIAVGPCGMGGFTILQLSYVVRQLAMQTGDGLGTDGMYSAADGMMMANAIYAGTIVVALAIWGMGFFWIIVAICSVTTVAIEKGISFSMGWWALTFPLVSPAFQVNCSYLPMLTLTNDLRAFLRY
jgi:tellurite resistance protein TehA-like permease